MKHSLSEVPWSRVIMNESIIPGVERVSESISVKLEDDNGSDSLVKFMPKQSSVTDVTLPQTISQLFCRANVAGTRIKKIIITSVRVINGVRTVSRDHYA